MSDTSFNTIIMDNSHDPKNDDVQASVVHADVQASVVHADVQASVVHADVDSPVHV